MSYPLVLFDGVCNLCNSSVNFIIKRDNKKLIKFVPLQSAKAQEILNKFGLEGNRFNTVVLIYNEKIYTKSSAAFEILKKLQTPLKFLLIFQIVPKFLLNKLYDFISENRYTWFGRRETCMVPNSELKNRFLE